MSITAAAIKQNRVTGVLVTVLLLAGTMSYLSMPQQMDPGFIIRTAQIVTRFPGASPDRVEQLVTDPIEQAVQSMPELDFVSSTSRTGVSVVAVNIREEFKDVRPIWDSLRRKVQSIEKDLPSGIVGPEINDELGDIYPMLFSMTADGFSDREMAEMAETIRDELLHIEGVGKVDILGDQEERVFVEFSNARLAQLGLSPMAAPADPRRSKHHHARRSDRSRSRSESPSSRAETSDPSTSSRPHADSSCRPGAWPTSGT